MELKFPVQMNRQFTAMQNSIRFFLSGKVWEIVVRCDLLYNVTSYARDLEQDSMGNVIFAHANTARPKPKQCKAECDQRFNGSE